MRDGWSQVALGSVASVTKGTSPIEKTPAGPYPLIVTAEAPRTSATYQFEGDAVCVPLVSSTGHGHASLKRVQYAPGPFALANIMVAIQVTKPALVDTKWLWLYLHHNRNELIVPLMRGTANVSLKPDWLRDVALSVPPLANQRRIVDLTRTLDDVASRLDTMESASRAALVGFLSAEFSPADAPAVAIRSCLSDVLGGDWGREPGKDEVDLPVYRQTEFTDIGQLSRPAGVIRSHGSKPAASRILREGDILLQKSAGTPSLPGRTVRCPPDMEDATFSNFLVRLRVDETRTLPSFVFWRLWHDHQTGRALAHQAGTSIRNLNVGDYLGRDMNLPDLAAQHRVAQVADELQAVVVGTRTVRVKVTAFRDRLLADLLSGEHEIPESYDRFLAQAS